jgi:hypothetical protein
MSDMMMLTILCNTSSLQASNGEAGDPHVVMPPPPIPANARAAINSLIFLASPQSKHPRENVEYANSRQALRPKMSLNLPYNGLAGRNISVI